MNCFKFKNCAQFVDNSFCCNYKMIKTMADSMELAAGVFQRCQTCTTNLFKIICEFNCSPNNADFMKVVENETNVLGGK